MTDREKFEKMSAENAQARKRSEAAAQETTAQQAEARAKQREADSTNAKIVFDYCKATFAGVKLADSGHELSVSQDDKIVHVSITHWGTETGDFQGHIPLVIVTCADGAYELRRRRDESPEQFDSLDGLKTKLLSTLGTITINDLKQLFSWVKSRRGR